jgi:hypothetical protein
MKTILSILAGLLLSSAASAATIEFQGTMMNLNVVRISGEIALGDANTFDHVTAPLSGRPTVVFLTSSGGKVIDAFKIGALIHTRGFFTAVAPRSVCASACGWIWLAGTVRYLSNSSKIGFHAAYRDDGSESGEANAIAGAYLRDLGLSIDAIAYVTQSGPTEVTWLHANDAQRVGITYKLVPDLPSHAPATPAAGSAMPEHSLAYDQGRQARIDFENWVNGIAEGEYKDGALWWSAHRSDKPPPNCNGPAEWRSGCLSARARLAPSDARRNTERDFWYGWNSLATSR